jgi:hypothetical protein
MIAQSTPSLWETLKLEKVNTMEADHLSILSSWLQRSKDLPLTLFLSCSRRPSWKLRDGTLFSETSQVQRTIEVLQALMTACDRWRTVDLDVYSIVLFASCWSAVKSNFPRLKEFRLAVHGPAFVHTLPSAVEIAAASPSLRTLALPVEISTLLLHSSGGYLLSTTKLITLDVRLTRCADYLKVSQLFPNLSELTVGVFSRWSESRVEQVELQDSPLFSFDHLCTLELATNNLSAIEDILEVTHALSLRNLKLVYRPVSTTDPPLQFSSEPITSLNVMARSSAILRSRVVHH